MTKIAVVGAGRVGSTFAYTLATSGLAREIVVTDADRSRAEGEAMDIAHAVPFHAPGRRAAGRPRRCGGRGGDGDRRSPSPRCACRLCRRPRSSAPARCSIRQGFAPSAYVLGEHGDSELVAWSAASLANVQLHEYCRLTDAPLNFFAPHNGYLARRTGGSQHGEFREMVDALHAAGIEVVLDAVYNHTGEGDHSGPTYSFKGIDNSTYYIMSGHRQRPYADFSGTGNTLNCANRAVRKLIMDSVRHWALDMSVDGFRLDLASVFARNADGSINPDEAPLLSDMVSDPGLAGLRLIAEPWDAAGA